MLEDVSEHKIRKYIKDEVIYTTKAVCAGDFQLKNELA